MILKGWGFGLTLFCFGVMGLVPGARADDALFVHLESRTLNEPETIDESLDEWGIGFERGGHQYSYNRFEIGYRWDEGYEVSAFQRAQLATTVNDRAAAFYGRLKRDELLSTGERIPVSLSVDGFSGHGVRFGYQFGNQTLRVGLGASLFRADRVLTGDLRGQFQATGPDSYQFDAVVDYRYHRDYLFDRTNIKEPTGLGWATDLHLQWRPGSRWLLEAHGKDLLAAIRWRDMPYTVGMADSAQKQDNDLDSVNFDPLLSGVEGYEASYRQSIDPRYRLKARYTADSGWTASGRVLREFDLTRPVLGFGWHGDGRFVEATFWPESDAVGLNANWNRVRVGIHVDSLQWEQLQAVGLDLEWTPAL